MITQTLFKNSSARLASLLLGISMLSAGTARSSEFETKFILHGWDLGRTTPENILAHAEQLNQLPIAGITVRLKAVKQADGSTISAETLPTDPLWQRESVAPLLPVYQGITAYENLKHTFVSCSIVPRNGIRYDWAGDDAEWERIANNLKVLAYTAKAGGLKGFFIDNEDYHKTRQFRYVAEADGDYDQTLKQVRKRGAQLFKPVFEEYPDIALMWFWAFSYAQREASYEDPHAALKKEGRLLPAFLNGVLDVMPPEVEFIDGNENAYEFRTARGDFNKSAVLTLWHVLTFIAPENRAKYRAQLRNSFGLYLDEFTGPKVRTSGKRKGQRNHWYRGPLNGSRAEHFREYLAGAAFAADGYIWLYGEKYSFINWGDSIVPKPWAQFSTTETWDDKLGLYAKLEMASNADAYTRKCLNQYRDDPTAVNLFAGIEGVKDDAKGYTSYITRKQITNRNYFVVSAEIQEDESALLLRWKQDEKWDWEPFGWRIVSLRPEGPADAEGWRSFFELIRVPPGGNEVHLQVTGSARNIALYRIDPPEADEADDN